MTDTGQEIAAHLIRIGAVSFAPENPYTWASGLKSPIYCDNRATLAHPEVRDSIAVAFCNRIDEIRELDAIVGVATGAIAHASFAAEKCGLPMGYVRSAAKGHGKGNRIEGFLQHGARVAVIEDLISTGGSSLSAVSAVRDAGMDVVQVLAIFSYGFPFAADAFVEADVVLRSLVKFDDLVAAGVALGAINDSVIDILDAWRIDPVRWSDARR